MRELIRMVVLGMVGTGFLSASLAFLISGYAHVGHGPKPKLVRRRNDPFGYWVIVIFCAVAGTSALLLLKFG